MLIDWAAALRTFRLSCVLAFICAVGSVAFVKLAGVEIERGSTYFSGILAVILPFLPLWPSPSRISAHPIGVITRIMLWVECLLLVLICSTASLFLGAGWEPMRPLILYAVISLCVAPFNAKSILAEARHATRPI